MVYDPGIVGKHPRNVTVPVLVKSPPTLTRSRWTTLEPSGFHSVLFCPIFDFSCDDQINLIDYRSFQTTLTGPE